MNLTEFASLKAGDKIDNHFSHSRGEVVDADEKGVNVRWGEAGVAGAGTIRHYSAGSTIWYHWSKVEDTADAERAAEARNEALP